MASHAPRQAYTSFPDKPFGFGMKAMKKFPELIPLVSILGFACSMAAAYIGYSLYQKSDVIVTKNSRVNHPWERVNPEQAQKLLTLNIKYEKNPELEALRKEIGSFKA